MIHATSKAVLIAWDMGQGPTFRSDGTRAHDLYRVYRATGGSTFLAAIGDTHAEAFYDTSVRRGAVYHYRVTAVAEDGSESPVGPTFTVHVPRVPPADRIAPTVPEKLTTTGWSPSSDSGSGVLAYFVERDSGPQPWAVLWNSGEDGPTSGKLHEWTDESAVKKAYRLRALDGALNLSAASNMVPVVGPEPAEPGGLICNDCHIGENCVIGNGTQWNESVNCGEDCLVGEDCMVLYSLGLRVVIGDRCTINAYVPSDTVIPDDTVWEG